MQTMQLKCPYKGQTTGRSPLQQMWPYEPTTAGTPFHKLKFDVLKTFGMLYGITTSKKGANGIWLAERFGPDQKTTWAFRQKVQLAMRSGVQYPLEDEAHVYEFEIEASQAGEQGRGKSDKRTRVVIAFGHRGGRSGRGHAEDARSNWESISRVRGRSGRGHAKVIEDHGSSSLKPLFDAHIKNDAKMLADGW